MMEDLLDQQWSEFRYLLTQELANARDGAQVVVKRLNNGPIPSHATTVQEGNNDSLSYQGAKEQKVWREDQPKSH